MAYRAQASFSHTASTPTLVKLPHRTSNRKQGRVHMDIWGCRPFHPFAVKSPQRSVARRAPAQGHHTMHGTSKGPREQRATPSPSISCRGALEPRISGNDAGHTGLVRTALSTMAWSMARPDRPGSPSLVPAHPRIALQAPCHRPRNRCRRLRFSEREDHFPGMAGRTTPSVPPRDHEQSGANDKTHHNT